MKVTVEMTAEEFEQFRAFQESEESLAPALEKKYARNFIELRDKHDKLCNDMMNGFDYVPGDRPGGPGVAVKDRRKALRAFETAQEWFA